MKKYLIKDIINSSVAISPRKGLKLLDFLKTKLKDKEPIYLSFKGIEEVVTAFTNASIGKLYMEFDTKLLDRLIHLEDLNSVWKNKFDQARKLGSSKEARNSHNDSMDIVWKS